MAKRKTVRSLACILWLCLSPPVSAFDCGKYPLKTSETIPPWADYIFDGKVKAVTVLEKRDSIITRVVFEVANVYKGAKKKEVTVRTATFGTVDSSGYPFLCGETYHVNAISKESGLYTDQCMQVVPLSANALDATEIERILLNVPSTATKKEQDRLWNRMYCR